MSDQAAPTPAAAPTQSAAPAAPQTSQAAPPAEPQAPAAPKPGDVGTPEWLNPRLDQAKRAARAELLKEIGVEDPAHAKRALDDARARADAEKTASELLASEKKAREKAERDAETYKTALSTRAEAEFAKLTADQQAFVEKQAGTDPAKRLATIEDVRILVGAPSGTTISTAKSEGGQAPPAAEPPKPAAPPPPERKPLPAPASTAPGGAPPGGQPPAPVDHLAVLERLDRDNPIAAGRYYEKHRSEITRLRAQKTAAPASQ